MADIKKVLYGTFAFLIGYFYCAISQYIFPPLIDFLGDTLGGILWFGVIITWVLAMTVIPIGFKIMGITESSESRGIFDVVIAILYAIFSLAIAYFTYYWNAPLTSIFTYDILIALYWVGYVMVWLFNIIVVPTYLIIQARGG